MKNNTKKVKFINSNYDTNVIKDLIKIYHLKTNNPVFNLSLNKNNLKIVLESIVLKEHLNTIQNYETSLINDKVEKNIFEQYIQTNNKLLLSKDFRNDIKSKAIKINESKLLNEGFADLLKSVTKSIFRKFTDQDLQDQFYEDGNKGDGFFNFVKRAWDRRGFEKKYGNQIKQQKQIVKKLAMQAEEGIEALPYDIKSKTAIVSNSFSNTWTKLYKSLVREVKQEIINLQAEKPSMFADLTAKKLDVLVSNLAFNLAIKAIHGLDASKGEDAGTLTYDKEAEKSRQMFANVAQNPDNLEAVFGEVLQANSQEEFDAAFEKLSSENKDKLEFLPLVLQQSVKSQFLLEFLQIKLIADNILNSLTYEKFEAAMLNGAITPKTAPGILKLLLKNPKINRIQYVWVESFSIDKQKKSGWPSEVILNLKTNLESAKRITQSERDSKKTEAKALLKNTATDIYYQFKNATNHEDLSENVFSKLVTEELHYEFKLLLLQDDSFDRTSAEEKFNLFNKDKFKSSQMFYLSNNKEYLALDNFEEIMFILRYQSMEEAVVEKQMNSIIDSYVRYVTKTKRLTVPDSIFYNFTPFLLGKLNTDTFGIVINKLIDPTNTPDFEERNSIRRFVQQLKDEVILTIKVKDYDLVNNIIDNFLTSNGAIENLSADATRDSSRIKTITKQYVDNLLGISDEAQFKTILGDTLKNIKESEIDFFLQNFADLIYLHPNKEKAYRIISDMGFWTRTIGNFKNRAFNKKQYDRLKFIADSLLDTRITFDSDYIKSLIKENNTDKLNKMFNSILTSARWIIFEQTVKDMIRRTEVSSDKIKLIIDSYVGNYDKIIDSDKRPYIDDFKSKLETFSSTQLVRIALSSKNVIKYGDILNQYNPDDIKNIIDKIQRNDIKLYASIMLSLAASDKTKYDAFKSNLQDDSINFTDIDDTEKLTELRKIINTITDTDTIIQNINNKLDKIFDIFADDKDKAKIDLFTYINSFVAANINQQILLFQVFKKYLSKPDNILAIKNLDYVSYNFIRNICIDLENETSIKEYLDLVGKDANNITNSVLPEYSSISSSTSGTDKLSPDDKTKIISILEDDNPVNKFKSSIGDEPIKVTFNKFLNGLKTVYAEASVDEKELFEEVLVELINGKTSANLNINTDQFDQLKDIIENEKYKKGTFKKTSKVTKDDARKVIESLMKLTKPFTASSKISVKQAQEDFEEFSNAIIDFNLNENLDQTISIVRLLSKRTNKLADFARSNIEEIQGIGSVLYLIQILKSYEYILSIAESKKTDSTISAEDQAKYQKIESLISKGIVEIKKNINTITSILSTEIALSVDIKGQRGGKVSLTNSDRASITSAADVGLIKDTNSEKYIYKKSSPDLHKALKDIPNRPPRAAAYKAVAFGPVGDRDIKTFITTLGLTDTDQIKNINLKPTFLSENINSSELLRSIIDDLLENE